MIFQKLRSAILRIAPIPRFAIGGIGIFGIVYLVSGRRWEIAVWFLVVAILVGLALLGINWVVRRREVQREKEFDQDLRKAEDGALTDLSEHWQRAVEELDKTGIRRYELPLYMLVGEPASGKTTTLRKSGLNFPIGMEAIPGSGGTRNCDWWFTDDGIILDTAGRLTFHDDDATDPKEWELFLNLLKRYRPRSPINGVVVVVPCTSLLEDDREKREHNAKIIRDALTDIQRGLEVRFPVYVLITKCDLIGGFNEYFQHLKAVDQLQLLGWSRPKEDLEQPFDPNELDAALAEIVSALRRSRFALLNQKMMRGEDTADVFPFPEELESVVRSVQDYLSEMFPESKLLDSIFFRGMYLTSGLRQGIPILQASNSLFGGRLKADLGADFMEQERALFIRDFYKKKLFVEDGLILPTRARLRKVRAWQRWGYGIAGVITVLGLTAITWDWLRVRPHVNEPLAILGNAKAVGTVENEEDFLAAKRVLRRLGKIDATSDGETESPEYVRRLLDGKALTTLFVSAGQSTIARDFTRCYRVVFDRMTGPFLLEIRDGLRDWDPRVAKPFDFVRLSKYIEAADAYHKLSWAQTHAGEPRRIESLFHVIPKNAAPWLQTSDHHRTLCRGYRDLRDLLEASGVEDRTPPVGSGLGLVVRGLADPALSNCLAKMVASWEAFLAPEHPFEQVRLSEDGLDGLDENKRLRNIRDAYAWCRLAKLRKDVLEILEEVSRAEKSAVAAWNGPATWIRRYGELDALTKEIQDLCSSRIKLAPFNTVMSRLRKQEIDRVFLSDAPKDGTDPDFSPEAVVQGAKENFFERTWRPHLAELQRYFVEKPGADEFAFRVESKTDHMHVQPSTTMATRLREVQTTNKLVTEYQDLHKPDRTSARWSEPLRAPDGAELRFESGPKDYLVAQKGRLASLVGPPDGTTTQFRQQLTQHILRNGLIQLSNKWRGQKGGELSPFVAKEASVVRGLLLAREADASTGAGTGFGLPEPPKGLTASLSKTFVSRLGEIPTWWRDQQSSGADPLDELNELEDIARAHLIAFGKFWLETYSEKFATYLAPCMQAKSWTEFQEQLKKLLVDRSAQLAHEMSCVGASLDLSAEYPGGHLTDIETLQGSSKQLWEQLHRALATAAAEMKLAKFRTEFVDHLRALTDARANDTVQRLAWLRPSVGAGPSKAFDFFASISAVKTFEQNRTGITSLGSHAAVPILGQLHKVVAKGRSLLVENVCAEIQAGWNTIRSKATGLPLCAGDTMDLASVDAILKQNGLLDRFLDRYRDVLPFVIADGKLATRSPDAPATAGFAALWDKNTDVRTAIRVLWEWQRFLRGSADQVDGSELSFHLTIQQTKGSVEQIFLGSDKLERYEIPMQWKLASQQRSLALQFKRADGSELPRSRMDYGTSAFAFFQLVYETAKPRGSLRGSTNLAIPAQSTALKLTWRSPNPPSAWPELQAAKWKN